MTAADQTERWTLHVHKGPHGGESSVAHTGQCIRDGEWIAVVPAAALDAAEKRYKTFASAMKQKLDAAREDLLWWKKEADEHKRMNQRLLFEGAERAERAEAELAKAKAEARTLKQELRDWVHGDYCGRRENSECIRLTEELKANP